MTNRTLYLLFAVTFGLLAACSQSETPAAPPANPAGSSSAEVGDSNLMVAEPGVKESDIEDYIRLFPYQDTFDYAVRYTGEDPARLNIWTLGAEPVLVKAGEDKVVRMNNDTFYKMAFVDLREGPVFLSSELSDKSRFVSFQLMDDRNVNYQNVIFPDGAYTLFHGDVPESVRGEAISVPSTLSVVIVRVEVRDPADKADVAAAEDVFRTITIEGPTPPDFPQVDVLSDFSQDVVEEAQHRMDEAFTKLPFRLTVVGPQQVLGDSVPYLNHAAGTKGGWGGPGTAHSSYETIFTSRDAQDLIGARGDYILTTEAPPVDAFWSVTVYDTDRGGFLHPNKYDRYHLNNTMAEPNEDGTYTFLFKRSCAGTDLNCLEVPDGRFDLTARYYLPAKEIQTGEWELPPLELVSPASG